MSFNTIQINIKERMKSKNKYVQPLINYKIYVSNSKT